jgi:nucleotide-binding universal stress UspA family protein
MTPTPSTATSNQTIKQASPIGPVLLASDLSARCDRALERAALLAKKLQTRLIVLHVLEHSILERLGQPGWPIIEAGYKERATSILLEDLAHLDVAVDALVCSGDVVEQIQTVMREHHCSLVITAHSHDHSLERLVRGSNVEKLARESDIPFLIVKKRVHQGYKHVVLASDFSKGSQHALQSTLSLIDCNTLTVFHAYDSKHHTEKLTANDLILLEEKGSDFVRLVQQSMLTQGLIATTQHINVVIELGSPSLQLKNYCQQHQVDLVVLGTHGVSGLVRTAMGSVAEKMLSTLTGDVMIVRQPHQLDA